MRSMRGSRIVSSSSAKQSLQGGRLQVLITGHPAVTLRRSSAHRIIQFTTQRDVGKGWRRRFGDLHIYNIPRDLEDCLWSGSQRTTNSRPLLEIIMLLKNRCLSKKQ